MGRGGFRRIGLLLLWCRDVLGGGGGLDEMACVMIDGI